MKVAAAIIYFMADISNNDNKVLNNTVDYIDKSDKIHL